MDKDIARKQKTIYYVGRSRRDMGKFPSDVQDDLEFALDLVARGEMPNDYKSFTEIGSGVFEIREQDGVTWYRVLYVAKLSPRRVYVLHAVKKDQNKLPKKDKELAIERYKEAKRLAADE
jgi:phage-related protein